MTRVRFTGLRQRRHALMCWLLLASWLAFDAFDTTPISLGTIPPTFAGGEPTLLYDLVRSQDGDAGISLITRAMAKARMKPPLVETT